jgi:hypothetical protein
MSKPPRWFPVVAATLGVRIALIAAACAGAGIGLRQLALFHDGWEYLRMAQAFALLHPRQMAPESLRLFPGYPLAIALVGLGRRPEVAGLAISLLCAAGCGPLTSRLGRDPRLAWWMVALTPSWLIYTSTAMSEGLATLLALLALLLTIQARWPQAGALVGLATIVRPASALLMVPLCLEACWRGGWRGLRVAVGCAAVAPLLLLVASGLLWGDALVNLRGYAESGPFIWPLQSLVENTLSPEVHLSRKLLTWGLIGVTFGAAWGLWRRWRLGDEAARSLLAWHLSSALFYLLYPSHWLFGSLDRYYSGLWPTTLIGLAPWIPRHHWLHAGLCLALSLAAWLIALAWLDHMAAVFPFAERTLP